MLVIFAFLAVVSAQNSKGAEIAGKVVDEGGAAIGRARITLFKTGQYTPLASVIADVPGNFAIGPVDSGSFRLQIQANGFRLFSREITVREDESANLGNLTLRFMSCDAPGVSCDPVFAVGEKPPPYPVSAGFVTSKLDCEIEFAHGKVRYGSDSKNADIRILRANGHIYGVALNGARLSQPNSSQRDCQDAQFGETQVQLDNLRRGDDFCVRTHAGLVSHVFPLDDIEPTSTEILLRQVTRKR